MHQYDDQVRPSVVLRRIIIIVAVLIAVPVALWTVTAGVRTYIGPPKLPTFRQLATPANDQQESSGPIRAAGDQSLWQSVTSFVSAHIGVPQTVRQLTAMFTGDSAASFPTGGETSPTSVEARGAGDLPSASNEPRTGDANASANSTTMTDASPNPMIAKSADTPIALAADPQAADAPRPASRLDATAASPWPPAPQQNAMPQTNPPWPPAQQPVTMQPASQLAATEQTAATDGSATEVVPAGERLTGRIPLPRRRPSDLTMVRITAANVPMPRPRPEIVGSVAPAETETNPAPGALNFLNNLFH